jgi:pyruvate kinase
MLSKYRSSVPIIAICPQAKVCSKLALYRGVWPVVSSCSFIKMKGLKQMLEEAETQALNLKLLHKGDLVVMMAGIPIAQAGSTNMIRIHRLGEPF